MFRQASFVSTLVLTSLLFLPACDGGDGDGDGDTSSESSGDGDSGDGDSGDGDSGDGDSGDGDSGDGDSGDGDSGDGDSGDGDTGNPDNPCGDISLGSGDPFTLDFGDVGTFTYEGGMPVCQMAGIHSGVWDGPDSTRFRFSGMSSTPLAETTTGTVINLTEVRWDRSAMLMNGQADLFTTNEAKAVVVSGGPFGGAAAWDPVTLCIYDVGEMSNINTGETATFPGPFGVACN